MENDMATIRKSTKDDMKQVVKLIKELAEFENMADQVKTEASVLIQDGFDCANPAFTCLVAELPDHSIIGYALYYISYSTWLGRSIFLEDLYVQPAHRGTGVGTKLFMAVAKIAHEMPSKNMAFHVLSWNPASEFYQKLGAVNMTDKEKWQLFRLNNDALNKMFAS